MDTIPVGGWMTPPDMLALASRVGHELARNCDIRSQRGKTFREAFMAASFAQHRHAQAVKLLPETGQPTPDFALRLDGRELIFENTEADNPLVHRNEAYETTCRQFELGAPYISPTPVMIAPAAYAAEITRLVAQKCAKRYKRCNGLLLRSNTTWITGLEDPPLAWWRAACAQADHHFEESWVFHHRHFFRLFP